MRRSWARSLLLLNLGMLTSACAPDPAPVRGNDIATLAMAAEGFSQAVPGHNLEFPRDHGAHPDFRIEWWYLTANLEDAAGQAYGAQWTLFRIGMLPKTNSQEENPWLSQQVYMAHAALTWPEGHEGFQRYARGGDHDGIAQAGTQGATLAATQDTSLATSLDASLATSLAATQDASLATSLTEPFAAWLDDWSLRSTGNDWLPLQASFREGDMGFILNLSSDQPLVLQGDNGFSQKHISGSGSYYYSQPFLQADGHVTIDGMDIAVTGQAWLDREWSSQFLQPGQLGWDWFALHLDSGEKLMLFRLREDAANTQRNDFQHAVLISPQGNKTPLDGTQIVFEVLESAELHGRKLPMNWRISLPEIDRVMQIKPILQDQWMDVDFAYWEGAVEATGDSAGTTGYGYLEMTGYPVTQ